MPTARRLPLVAALLLPIAGCDVLNDAKDGVDAPTASFLQLDVVKAPTPNNMAAWACYEWLDRSLCQVAGWDRKPGDAKMQLSFDIVFELGNPNTDIPIPLVELLLGMTVIEDTNLGAVCISFCDPDSEECTPEPNAEGACTMDDVTEVTEPSDLVPTVDDLLEIGEDVLTGDLEEDNWSWRTIPPQETVESHVRFDLATDTVYRLAEALVTQAAEDFIDGEDVSLTVPYTVEGSLFFNVPRMGRYALGFGPTDEREFSLVQ
jgi:hypothetical protein